MKASFLSFFLSLISFITVAQDQVYIVCGDRSLYLIDVSSCSSQLIGKTRLVLTDIAYNPINGTYYGVSVSRNIYTIYTIDVSNGDITYVARTTIQTAFNSLTFDNNGTLYAMSVQTDNLYTIDINNGTTTNLGSTGTGIFSSGDLTFNLGKLYLAGAPNYLIEIDPNIPSNSTVIGRISSLGTVFGLTSIGCLSDIYAFSGNDIHILDQINLTQSRSQCANIVPINIYGAAAVTELFSSTTLNLGMDTILCPGDSLTLSASIPNVSYLWQDGSTNSSLKVGQQGTYRVQATYSNSCILSDTINVSYLANTIVNLGNDTILCPGKVLTLDATAPNASYLWQDNSTNSTFNATQQGSYWVEVKKSNSCISKDTIIIDYPPTINLGKDSTLCQGEVFILDVNTPNARYIWQDNSTNSTFNITQSGTYWVEVTNSNSCISNDTIIIDYAPKTIINLGKDSTLCQGEMLILDATTPNASYLWQDNSTDSIFNTTQQGTYWLEITNSNSCISNDTIVIDYVPNPVVNLGNDTSICKGTTLVLDATTPNASYLWQDNSTNSTFNTTQQGTYWVKVTKQGCTKTDTIVTSIENCERIFDIPNIFTPNKDGKNDLFISTTNQKLKSINTTIYDRWGTPVFKSQHPLINWDGYRDGRQASEGVYFWVIDYIDFNGNQLTETGRVTLLR
ncbi:MAG: gliding motility-associated C-terminal domain-containing protein [Flavobacteriales bacterium]|nr:gliding motility-associated C-terminal domain-containing protein [Flavobacteriales bacterium]